ncbi:MAG: hypothetical protein ACOX8W_01380 [bacterium]|jgi:hypothetical protein
MTFNACVLIGILLLAAFLAGYAFGRRTGLREGCRAGLAEAPLRLREMALLETACPVCGTGAAEPLRRSSRG